MDYQQFFADTTELEKILNQYDPEMLKRLCSFLIRQYVINNGIDFNTELDDVLSSQGSKEHAGEINTFPQLIKSLQQNYNFTELYKFSIEDGNVYITIDGRKYLINSPENKTESLSPKIQPPVNKPVNKPDKKEISDLQNRFKNIELD